MNGPATVSDKLGLGPEVRELKFGDSFANGRGTGFHTVRYVNIIVNIDSLMLHHYTNALVFSCSL